MIKLSDYLKNEYGEKIYKLSLSSGCTCPNRDGKVGVGGCTFCSEGGSGDFAAGFAPISQQMEEAKSRIASKTDAKKFIAYFQSYTNTYFDNYANTKMNSDANVSPHFNDGINRLRELYTETINRDDIAILSIGTRPDCLGEDVIEMLSELNRIKPVWVELGLQTIHDETAKRINRCYPLSTFDDAYQRLKDAGITVIVHVIFGLPGESKEDMLETIKYLAELNPPLDGIKIQMLHVLKGTTLEEEYEREPFYIMSMDEYAELVAESIKLLPDNIVVHRITGDGPGKLLIEPEWSRNKRKVMNRIEEIL